MSSLKIKERLHQYIDLADERFAEALLAMFENYYQNQKKATVAYTIKNEPLTKSQIIKEVMDAVQDVEKGNYYTTDEVRKNLKKR